MNENGPVYILMMIFVLIATFIFGGAVNGYQWQKEAVKAGAAEWVADENGDAKFQFKTK
jgi:hypothetical protein